MPSSRTAHKLRVAWIVFALITAVLMPFMPLLPQQIVLYVVVEGLALLFAVMATFRYRTLPILLLTLAFTVFFLGDNIYVFYDLILGKERSFPGLGDVFYLSFYVFAITGLLLVVKQDLATALDAVLITLGLAVPWWLFIEYPTLSAPGFTLVERLVTVAYPLGDLLLIMLVVRILLANVNRSIILLGSGLSVLAATDSVYSIQQLQGTFVHGSWLDAGWFLFYILWGLAFLYPFQTVRADLRPAVTNSRVGLIFSAIVLPMLSVFVGLVISGQNAQLGYLIGVCFIVLVLCVLAVLRISRISVHDEELK